MTGHRASRRRKLTAAVALAALPGLVALPACRSTPTEVSSTDAAPVVRATPSAVASQAGPVSTVNIPGSIDRPRAEQIGLEYARKRWPEFQPKIATAFIEHDGSFHVVVGFVKRRDAASVYVRNTDGDVMDASIAPLPSSH
jgi:hypothetical protein